MSYISAIKDGFKLVNSRWQLVLVQVGMMFFNCLGFFIMVGIPLGVAFIIFGLDLTSIAEMRDIFGILRNPADLISKYFGLVLIIVASFLLYLLLVATVGLYVFSGSIGIIGRSITEPAFRFSMHDFFGEARRFFFPLMWYTSFAGLIFIAIAFGLGILGGGIGMVVNAARGQDSTLALFLGSFFYLLLVIVGLAIIMGALSVTIFGIAVLYFRRAGAVRSFNESCRFLWDHQHAFWLYVILFVGYILVSFLVMLVIYPFNLIPFIGPVISFPFQILSYIVQGYLGLVILAAIFTYYYDSELRPAASSGAAAGPTGPASTGGEHTSPSPDPGPGTVPPLSGPREEGL